MNPGLSLVARAVCFLATAILLGESTVRAQLVSDGATNTLSNVTNGITGNVTIGTNGSFTLLVLSDNALLTNSANGIIGRNSTAKSNEVRLISSTARWRLGGSLFVGSSGAASSLVVSNGALLEDFNGNLGFTTVSSNNSALVTGAGSLWTNRGSFSISGALLANSRSNRLVVSNSGALVSVGGATVDGVGNQMVVTGAGSRWANESSLSIGGGQNRLDVSEGAALVSSNANIGDFTGGGDVTVLLTDPGSVWSNTAELQMGYGGARGVLVVSNGASVILGGPVRLGVISGATSNTVSVTGPGTSLTIGSDLYVGSLSTANLLTISNGGLVVSSNVFLGFNAGAPGNSALAVGSGTVWSNRNDFTVGSSDGGNQLVLSNGATLTVGGNLLVGANSGSAGNRVVVDGGDLRVTNATGTAELDVRRGTNVLNAGLVEVDQLLVTNTAGKFEFNGGTLSPGKIAVNSGQLFRIGNGVSAATFNVAGSGTNTFGNGLTLSTNAALTGIVISKNGTVLANNQLQITGTLTCGGSLTVSNLGPTALAYGDRFKLFDATTYGGSFSALEFAAT